MIEYCDIVGFPGYRVGNDGTVQSCWRKTPIIGEGRRGTVSSMGTTWHIIKPHSDRDGYLQVGLSRDGKRHTKKVHTLVLLHFVGPCPPGMECLHNDGDPGNNALSNIKWGTPQANLADKVRHGRIGKGESHYASTLAETHVLEMRRLHSSGMSRTAIAKQFGISYYSACQIISRRRWKHLAA